jgi:signal transduction histidine kinase
MGYGPASGHRTSSLILPFRSGRSHAVSSMNDDLDFLLGGGEMGARMRAIDWSSTPLGPAAKWPQNLKTCVRIVLTSRQAMFVWWGDQLINLYNDAYKSIVGGKHPDALGKPAHLVWREIWDQVGPRAAQTMRGHEGTYDEALLLIMERNGYPEETYYTFSYSPVPNDHGGTGGIICANTDDTRRILGERQVGLLRDLAARTGDARRIEEAAAAAAASLASNQRDLPFALIYLVDAARQKAVLTASTGIDRSHRAAPSVVQLDSDGGWPMAAAIERHETVLVDDLSGRFGDLPSGAWPKSPSRAALLPIAPSGSSGRAGVLVVGLNPYRLFDDDYRGFLHLVAGQVAAGIANAQAYEEEKKRSDALAELDRAKTAFFSNVSHEFRTPLTLMLGPTEDALASRSGSLEGESLRTVHRNAQRLLKLVNALLDFSRIEAGRANASYRPTDLASLTADLASAFRSAVERADLTLQIECAPLPEPVFVDHDMWEKIVLNLVSNALKFTFQGAITVSLSWTGQAVELLVRDTGTGIPQEELSNLFVRFHRVQGARARTHEGSGIGLALVHELVRLHGGTIEVASEVGQGTAFTVRLRGGSDHLPAERVRDEGQRSPGVAQAAPYVEEALRWLPAGADGPAISPESEVVRGDLGRDAFPPDLDAHILLADDNADMRDYVARLLRRRWTVDAVGDGEAALEAARRRVPDLVLTDVMMPILDGFALLRELRRDAATRDVPVIMLSARAGEESRVVGLEAGADDYLAKPFSSRELVARVTTRLQLARLRRTAERERRKLHDFLMESPVPVAVVVGPEPRFELANPAYCAMVQRKILEGALVSEVFPELEQTRIARALETGERFESHEEKIRFVHDGVPRDGYYDVVIQPLRDEQSTVSRVMCVAIEVTEQVVARQRVDLLRETAERASRAKDEFLSTLSHELRTPLNAIVGWATLLQRGTIPAAQVPRVIDTIERNARVQARLIEDMLELSRIEQGKMVLSVGPVEMVRVVEAAIDAVKPAADAKGVAIQPVLDSHATLAGDPDRLQQVVWNLLTNAIKFTPRGGRVLVELRREHSYVEVTVADTGQGIERDFLTHVFDRFRQADGSFTRNAGGLGLGLAIVRSLVELHGGQVTASSEGPRRGAVFVVRLPTAPLRSEKPADRDAPAAAPRPLTFERPPELRGLRVLVVDDEPETRELLAFVLAQCDVQVTSAASAAEALKHLEERVFDAIVSDIGMPGEDGHSLVRRTRLLSNSPNAKVPAVALTAYARSEDRTAALRAGYDIHLAKPIDPGELLVVLGRLTSRNPSDPRVDPLP